MNTTNVFKGFPDSPSTIILLQVNLKNLYTSIYKNILIDGANYYTILEEGGFQGDVLIKGRALNEGAWYIQNC